MQQYKNAKIGGVMIVVYSPGVDAEFLGEPLDTLELSVLNSLGLKDFYATCMVKCPSKTPKVKEVSTCVEYIMEEIRQMRPSHILVFGEKANVAMKRFGVIDSISSNYIQAAVHPFPAISRILNSGHALHSELKQRIKDILNA